MAVLGTGWIDIMPVTAGFGTALNKEVGAAMKEAEATLNANAGLFEKLSGLAPAILATAGVAIAAYSVEAATKFQAATVAVETHAGITAKAANAMGDAFLETAFKSTFSAQEMMTSYAGVAGQWSALQGSALSTADTVKLMAASTDLAEATSSNLGATTQALTKVLITYKAGVAGAADATDVLFNTSLATGVPVDALANIVDKLHAKMGDLTPSLAETSTLLVEFGQQGNYGAKATLALNSAFQTISNESAKVTAEASKLGLTIFDTSGKFTGMKSLIEQLQPKMALLTSEQQKNALVTLFGKQSWDSMLQIINAGVPGWDRATAAVDKQGTAAAAAARAAGTFEGQLKTLGAGAQDLAVVIGKVLLRALEDVTKPIVVALNWVIHTHDALAVLAGVITAAAVPALLRLALSFGGTLIGAVTSLGAAFVAMVVPSQALAAGLDETAVSAAAAGVGFDAMLGPIGIAIGVLTAVYLAISHVSAAAKLAKTDASAFATGFMNSVGGLSKQAQIDAITAQIKDLTLAVYDGHGVADAAAAAHRSFADQLAVDRLAASDLGKQLADLKSGMQGQAAGAAAAAAATGAAGTAAAGWTAEMIKAADAADKDTKAQIALSTGMSGFSATVGTAANDLATYGNTLDLNTVAGQKNTDSLAAMATKIVDQGKILRDAQVSGDEYNQILSDMVAHLDGVLKGAKFTGAQIQDLNDKLGLSALVGTKTADSYTIVGHAAAVAAPQVWTLAQQVSQLTQLEAEGTGAQIKLVLSQIALADQEEKLRAAFDRTKLAVAAETSALDTQIGRQVTASNTALTTAGAYRSLTDAFDQNTLAANAEAAALGKLVDTPVAASDAAVRYEQQLDSLRNALGLVSGSAATAKLVWDAQTGGLNITTLTGRNAVSVINQTISAMTNQAQAMMRSGVSAKDVNAMLGAHVGQLNDTLGAAGLTAEQIAALDKSYGLLPDTIAATVAATVAQTTSLNSNTAAGEAAVKAINATVSATVTQAKEMLATGTSVDAVNKFLGDHVDTLDADLKKAGLTTDQIDALNKQYNLSVPALDALVKSQVAAQTSMDLNTAAGRANNTMVLNLQQAILTLGADTFAATGNLNTATAAMDAQKAKLGELAAAVGIATGNMVALNTQYALIPPTINTKVTGDVAIDTTKAVTDLQALQALFAASPAALGVTGSTPITGFFSGGITRGPAIAGEGRAPEVIIPLDSAYKSNAEALTRFAAGALGLPMLAGGGIAGLASGFAGLAGDVGATVIQGEHDLGAKIGSAIDARVLAALAASATSAGGGGGLSWPFPTQAPTQFQRVDEGWDLQEGPGGTVLSVAAGLIGMAGADPGGFGNDYPYEILDKVLPGYLSDTIYYGHTHALAGVIGKHVADGVAIATTNMFDGQNGSAAPPGWLEIGWAQTGTGSPLSRGAGATSGGQSIRDILLTPRAGLVAGPGGSISSPVDFAVALEKALGDPVTNPSNAAIMKWVDAEGGQWHNAAHFNPLNTTQTWSGSLPMNSVGVQSFLSWADGIAATVKTINNGNYPNIVADLITGKGFGPEVNPDLSKWGTGPIFDAGGWLMPGTTIAQNNTGRPERVLPPGGGGNITVEKGAIQLTFTGPVNNDTAVQIQAQIDGSITKTLTAILDRHQAARPGG